MLYWSGYCVLLLAIFTDDVHATVQMASVALILLSMHNLFGGDE